MTSITQSSSASGADPVQLPEPFASIPRKPLLFGPSPIQHLPRITEALGGKVGIYAKREDCNSGFAYGGNKTRKLEYVFQSPSSRESHADTLQVLCPRCA
jgi:1-aminocyclopropane-1-carboxylate deaminase/D-cysteine desulfhydrase-like pyridoxal-dependent ACC family enzyme